MKKIPLNYLLVSSLAIGFAATTTANAVTVQALDNASLSELNNTTASDVSNYVSIRSRNIPGSLRHDVGAFKFATSTLAIGSLTSATLELGTFNTVTGAGALINVYGLNNGVTKGSVTEANWTNAVTYDTMPGLNGTDGNLLTSDLNLADLTSLGTIDTTGVAALNPDSLVLNSSASLLSFLNADTNGSVTFILEADFGGASTDNQFQILSTLRGGAGTSSYPKLTAVPEPAQAALGLGVVALMVMCLRRRRS